jgi:signal transduction histidine kinase/tetratricopeptide (TPR) repeat protein
VKSLLLLKLFLLTQIYYFHSYAQQELPAHVKTLLSTTDSLKKQRQFEEGLQLLTNYVDQAPDLELNDNLIMAELYYTKGDLLKFNNRNRESIIVSGMAAALYEKAGLALQMADCYSLVGENHIYLGNYEEALISFNKALEIDEALGNSINVAVALNSIGKAYELCKEFDKALEFFTRSLQIAREHNQPNMVALRLASIASIYKNLNHFDKALELLNEALEIETAQNNIVRKGYRLDMMGEVYTLKREFATAESYLMEALQIFKDNNIMPSESIVLNHLAYNAFQRGATDKAIEYYHQSLGIAEAISFRNMLEKNNQELSLLYEQIGNFKNALGHYQTFIALRDSSVTEKTREQLLDFQVRYETQEKEKELAMLSQEKLVQELQLHKARQLRYIIIGVLAISLMLLFFLYSRFLIKKRSQIELAALNAQLIELNSTKDKLFSIIAHDLRNNVSAFSNLLTNLNRGIQAMTIDDLRYYLEALQTSANSLKFMLKNLLEWAMSQQNRIKITLEEIEAQKLINDISDEMYTIMQAKNISIDNQIAPEIKFFSDRNILFSVIRNIMFNSIKYSHDNSKIEVLSQSFNGFHQVIIKDYGIGMEQDVIDSILNAQHIKSKPGVNGEMGTGLGLKLSMELIGKVSGKIHINSQPGEGSTFIIQISVN